MQCPRCHSRRVQRDYDDALILVRLAGMHKALCNNCGLVFKRFDPLGKLERTPSKDVGPEPNRRRGPRYHTHLPAAISLIEGKTGDGKVPYSQPSRAHCEEIGKHGMGFTLVGTRFQDEELSRPGRLLFVRVDLPEGPIEAVVTIVTHGRGKGERKRKWFLGVKVYQMSEADTVRLDAYLEDRSQSEPLVISE